MFKKVTALLTATLMATMALTGCASNTPTQPSTNSNNTSSTTTPAEPTSEPTVSDTNQPVTLTLWVTTREQDDVSESIEEEFLSQYPHITLNKVIKEGDPGNEFYQAVAAGNAPDVVSTSFTMMDKYINAGILEPLNTYFDTWSEKNSYSPIYLERFTKNDNIYGIAHFSSSFYLGYNKNLFAEAGITSAPTNWDEAFAAAQKLTVPDKQQYGYGVLSSQWTEWFFQYYVWQAGGDLTKQNPDGTLELTFTDPAVIKAAEYYQKLRREKVMQSDLTLTFDDMIQQFAQGKIAMMPFAGDWVSWATALGADPDNIGLALLPAGPSGQSVTTDIGACYVINATTSQAQKDAAWKYIEYYTSREVLEKKLKNLESKGAVNPMNYPYTDFDISSVTSMNPEYSEVIEAARGGRLEFYGKDIVGTYVDRVVQKLLADPNADPLVEFTAAQEAAQKEVVNDFNQSMLDNK
ncbi:MAG: extracellular solute-binding protein [Cellulosilyticaceae bacterium]